MRHLPATDIPAILRRGKSVEQFVGRSPANPDYIRHIELRPSNDSIQLWVYDVEDIGGEEWLDLYDFPYLEPDGPEAPVAIFQDAQAAVAYAASTFLAAPDRWTNQLIAQDEYLDYIRADRPLRWPPAA